MSTLFQFGAKTYDPTNRTIQMTAANVATQNAQLDSQLTALKDEQLRAEAEAAAAREYADGMEPSKLPLYIGLGAGGLLLLGLLAMLVKKPKSVSGYRKRRRSRRR